MKTRLLGTAIVVALLAVLVWSATYCVSQNDYGLQTRFGRVVAAESTPGLHWKLPFDRVHRIDGRITGRSYPGESLLSNDGRALTVDFNLRWRVSDPQRFFEATGGDEDLTAARLADIVRAEIKAAAAQLPLARLQAASSAGLGAEQIARARRAFGELGVEFTDVALQRVDLADDIAASVYQRMQESYLTLAKQLRSTGSGEGDTIRADADRRRTEALANAARDAQRIRGEGDAEAAATYARAYGRNAEFAAFYRSLAAYRNSLGRDGDVLVISPDGEFFRYLHSSGR
jgi:membrane protease subunit HflC